MAIIFDEFSRGWGARVDDEATMTAISSFIDSGNLALQTTTPPEQIAFALGRRARTAAPDHLHDWFDAITAEDMFIAICCEARDPGAYRIVEDRHGAELRALLSRYAHDHLGADDLYQRLFERVFVGSANKPAKILEYSGRGLLRNWLRVTGVRLAIDSLRLHRPEVLDLDDEIFSKLSQEEPSPELQLLKTTYRAEFKAAFQTAVRQLEPLERNLLRQHLVGGLSIDRLAELHKYHRATAARKLARIRQKLFATTRRELMRRLSVGADELDSIMRLISSQLDASLIRLLQERDGIS